MCNKRCEKTRQGQPQTRHFYIFTHLQHFDEYFLFLNQEVCAYKVHNKYYKVMQNPYAYNNAFFKVNFKKI